MKSSQLNARDKELFGRMRVAAPEQLAGLVDALTDEGKGRVAMAAPVGSLLVKSRELGIYTDETRDIIGAEILAFGGRALANAVRRRGISYRQLLRESIKYLGGTPDKRTDVHALEDRVIHSQLEALLRCNISSALAAKVQWILFKFAEGGQREGKAAADFLCSNAFDFNLIHEGAQRSQKFMRNLARQGLGPAILAKTHRGAKVVGKVVAATSSHRVTLPCINHLIRMRFEAPSGREPVLRRETGPRRSEKGRADVADKCLVVEDQGGNRVLTAVELEVEAMPAKATRLDHRRSGLDRWSPLLQGVPAAMLAKEVAGERYMKVVINGPLAVAKDGDGYRGFVQGAGGQISGQARLYEGNLSQLVSAAALYNIASFAVGQKHMADISAHLENIQKGVDDISRFQQRERESEIRGALRYLQQVGPLIMDGQHTPAQLHRLEACEAELLKVQEHLASDISSVISQARDVPTKAALGVASSRDRFIELQETFEGLAHQWMLCLKARMVACRLLCSFEGTAKIVETREASIRSDVAWFTGPPGMPVKFADAVNQRAANFTALTESRIELRAHRELLKVLQHASLPVFEHEASSAAESFSELLRQTREPLEIMVAMTDGEVREMALLS